MKKIGLVLTTCLLFISVSFLTPGSASAFTSYSDIPFKHRAYKEITYLGQSNITTSDSSTLFSPDAPMTRAHAAMMIGKAIELNGKQGETRFSDVKSSHVASGYITESVNRGIIKGYAGDIFKPDETLTRGEMARLISRAFGYNSETVAVASQELMDKGISKGTGNGIFGINELMKRVDFAIFLSRAINAEFRVGGQALTATPMYVAVNEDDALNMRNGPSTKYQEVKKLFTAYPVKALYQVGNWVYAKVGNDHGFLHSDYLSTDQPFASTIKDPIDVIVKRSDKTIDELVVIIDPGHGGTDSGATGNGFLEKNITLDISRKMKNFFDKTPIQAKLTRTNDSTLPLQGRPKFARENNGDIFISVHTNAFNKSANGQETYYYAAATGKNPYVKESRALAIYTHNRMLEAWKLTNRGVNPHNHTGNFHVLRENTMPATLVEVGFIDSIKDIQLIKSDAERNAMAKALFLGSLDYYYHFEGRTEVASLYSAFNAKPSTKSH